jgi:hypothetical protein
MSTQAGQGSGTTVVGNAAKQTWPYVSEPDFSQTFETAGLSRAPPRRLWLRRARHHPGPDGAPGHNGAPFLRPLPSS